MRSPRSRAPAGEPAGSTAVASPGGGGIGPEARGVTPGGPPAAISSSSRPWSDFAHAGTAIAATATAPSSTATCGERQLKDLRDSGDSGLLVVISTSLPLSLLPAG